jgi:hypothetical protein
MNSRNFMTSFPALPDFLSSSGSGTGSTHVAAPL